MISFLVYLTLKIHKTSVLYTCIKIFQKPSVKDTIKYQKVNLVKISAIPAQVAKTFNCIIVSSIALVMFNVIFLSEVVDSCYGLTTDKVLATVDNEVITLSDYKRFIKETGYVENKDVINESLLKRLIEERLILHEAKRRGIEASDTEIEKMIKEFKEQHSFSQEDLEKDLAREGMSIRSYKMLLKDEIMSLKLISINVDSKIIITDNEIEDFYNANKKDYLSSPEKVEIRAIFLCLNEDASVTEITDFKRKVLKIVARLKDDESFEKLMDQYSEEYLNSQEGRLGEFVKGALIPPLDNKAFSMKKGEISDPIWVGEGVYILQLINRTAESYKSVEEVKEEIKKRLYELKREKLLNEWIRSLWENASVTIN